MFALGLINRLIRRIRVESRKESSMNTWHVAGPNGGPPLPDYRYHTYLDCGNLQRIIRPQPERRRMEAAVSMSAGIVANGGCGGDVSAVGQDQHTT